MLPRSFIDRPIAHRGLHDVTKGVPENSASAFEAAIEAGYGIELDVQLSADDDAMVFHDYDLNRLTAEKGPIRQRTTSELARTKLRGGLDAINTLPRVLDLVSGRVPLLIEIKDQDGAMGPNVGALEDKVASAVRGYDGAVAVMSFNPNAVARMAELLPQIPRGIVTSAFRPSDWPVSEAVCDRLREIPDYDRTGACFVSHEANDLQRPRVSELKAQGAQILCWTIKSEAQATEALKIAQNITFEGYLPA